MRKHLRFPAWIAAFLVAAALLAACSAPAKNGSGTSGKPDEAAPPAEPAATAASQLPLADPGSAGNYGKKIIYTVNISLEAGDAAKTVKDISSAATELGGYVSSMQYDESNHEGTITVRIVPEKLVTFTEKIGAMGKLLGQNMSSQDVTDSYYDVQSRLTNAQAQETQLLSIMKQAVKIDDILKVRQELNTVQQEIEQLKGQIRLMDNQIGFSTVTISVRQPKPPAVTVDDNNQGTQFWGFPAIGQKISRGVADSFNWTLNALGALFIGLSYVIVPLIIIAVAVMAIILIVKTAGKRKKKG